MVRDRVGFGCASLGSRIGAREGLAALERAHDAGVRWFDVAPSYGDGEAEVILGQFAAGRRGDMHITSKVGLVARAVGWKRMLRPLARGVVARFPALRGIIRRAHGHERAALTAAAIIGSVEASLGRLGVERIDALMLHQPDVGDVGRDEVHAALAGLRASGKVGVVGVAGSAEAGRMATRYPEVFSVIQIANNPFDPGAQADWVTAWRAGGGRVVTHSSIGAFGAMQALMRAVGTGRVLRAHGYAGDDRAMVAAFLIDYGLATHRDGISLFSMLAPEHLRSVMARAGAIKPVAEMVALGETLAGGTHDRRHGRA